MTSLKIVSLNCRGLSSDKIKRHDIFDRCRNQYDITVLIDTHSSESTEKLWLDEWGYKGHFCSCSSTKRGIAILFKNSFEYKVHGELKDKGGNYLILDMSISRLRFSLLAVYGPNDDDPSFYGNLLDQVLKFENTSIIAVGDWNIVQNYSIDTKNYKQENNTRAQAKLSDIMSVLDLNDIWRQRNPDVRHFTWRGPHGKLSRLDYFLVSSDIESFVSRSDIGYSYRSDHCPVILELILNNQDRGRGTWKFNNSLLSDKDYVQKVKQVISDIISEYSIPSSDDNTDVEFSISHQLLWDTMKMKIRGMTIAYTSHLKKEKVKEESRLEVLLKQKQGEYDSSSGNIQLYEEINVIEKQLQENRENKIRGMVARAKAKWQAEGEKSSRYFCNLEKRHYVEKLIPKLISDDNSEITDLKSIISEQVKFYKKLYSTSSPTLDDSHKQLFFDDHNPFIKKLDNVQKEMCEGALTYQECLMALKNMKNYRSPGLDGFTTEFYKFFWNDCHIFLLASLNEGYEKGELSISQRQGVITCLPKEDKCKYYLKNWRPITLINCDVKIGSAAIANRMKPILQDLISDTQKGFLKGRYIGECTRTILDILDSTEDEDIPGLLLMLDFEKAFDSVEWSFIHDTLQFYGFGEYFCNWIKCFYSNVSSCVLNNGHCSEFFHLERGVRQGDPLSPYLFIMVLELLSCALKNDPQINGIKINDSEFLLSQYADDSSLTLDDNPESLEQTLYILHKFSQCAGLRANLDKTQAVWIGSKVGSRDILLPEKNLLWNHSGKFKLLGIYYDLTKPDKTLGNFIDKIQSVKRLLNNWIYRELTFIGKVTIIKTLALPILIQLLTVLPNPPDYIFNDIQKLFFNFFWNGKPDRIKRNILINDYCEGGLKIPHVKSFCFSLKMTWIHKLLDPLNFSPWKILIMSKLEKFGGEKVFHLGKMGIQKVADTLNTFWRDILLNWLKLNELEPKEQSILCQPLWFNQNIKINKEVCFYHKWCDGDIFFINDLINDDNLFLNYNQFKEKYNIPCSFLDFYGIVHAIPKEWKERIKNETKMTAVENELLNRIKLNPKSCKFIYSYFIKEFTEEPLNAEQKWEVELGQTIEDWYYIFSLPFSVTKNNKLIILQFKILHRIFASNSFLFKCKLKETELCSFCGEAKEIISHLFWDCNIVRNFWISLQNFFSRNDISIPNNGIEILFGCNATHSDMAIDNILLIAKYYIHICRLNHELPILAGILEFIKKEIYIEKMASSLISSAKRENTEAKWRVVSAALEQN